MKKIFVIYASAGQGHTKAAQVVFKYICERERDSEVRLIDALDFSSPLLKASYEKGYNFVIRHAQWLWWLIFYGSSLRLPFGLSRRLNSFSNRMNAGPLYRLIEKEKPDVIISTHFLPCQVAAELKNAKKISSCLVTVITDFGVHPFWVANGTDLYAAASPATKRTLEAMGVDARRVAITGIPVAPGFPPPEEKMRLRQKLGIPADRFTVLLVTGSFGIGPLERISRLLYRDCQVLVVCARNKKLQERLAKENLPNVKVYGFVQNMSELMTASDVVVTKPGGLSISELLVQETVPVFICAIPGQESENVKALLREGIGTYSRNAVEVRRTVLRYRNEPSRLQAVRNLILKARKPDSAAEIWNAIRAYCSWFAC